MNDEMYVPPIRPNQVPSPSKEIFAHMGADNVYKMLSDFYALLGQSAIKDMFPKDLERASQKSADFFIGVFGGPPLYHQKYGNPMMRARHMPFAIDGAARLVWLECFEAVLEHAPEKYNFPVEHLLGFREFLVGFSAWMVNKR